MTVGEVAGVWAGRDLEGPERPRPDCWAISVSPLQVPFFWLGSGTWWPEPREAARPRRQPPEAQGARRGDRSLQHYRAGAAGVALPPGLQHFYLCVPACPLTPRLEDVAGSERMRRRGGDDNNSGLQGYQATGQAHCRGACRPSLLWRRDGPRCPGPGLGRRRGVMMVVVVVVIAR